MYELAYNLRLTVGELEALPYDEILGWHDYFSRRPVGWREDNRSAVQVMAMAGSKVRPEALFTSLKQMRVEQDRLEREEAYQQQQASNFAAKFFNTFNSRFTDNQTTNKLMKRNV